MKMKPVFIAFSTQKGGVGKTTFTVLAASYLHYVCGYNVLVVDCDYPQFSINEMRKRDAKGLETNSSLQELAIAQFSRLQKPTYSILCTTSDEAIGVVQDYLEQNESETDFVFFDLPGTINTRGVSFSAVIKQAVTDNADTDNKGIYLFWNMVDGREKTPLYAMYEKVIAELGLPILKTSVPNTTRYKKEVMDEGTTLFRSTIFPASRTLLRGSRLKELVEEILSIVKPEAYGREA